MQEETGIAVRNERNEIEEVRGGFLKRSNVFLRSTDKGQRRAAGNIIKFLALLLALTLIARGTSGATLARVDLSLPSRSTITEAVTGTATVSSRDTTEITAPKGITIVEMMADTGQSVKSGDALARFDMEEVTEKLEREAANLEKMLIDLEKLERTDSADSSSIESAQRSLRRAADDYSAVKAQGESDVATAQDALDEALSSVADVVDVTSLQTAVKNHQRALDDYNATKAQGDADVASALEALETAKENEKNSSDSSPVETARRNLQRAKEDYTSTKAQGDSDVSAAVDAFWRDPDNEQLAQAMMNAQKRADDNLVAAARKVEDAEISLSRAEQDYEKNTQQSTDTWQADIDKAQSAYDNALKKAEENLQNAMRKVEDAEASLSKAESDFNKNVQQSSDSLINEIERAQSALESARSKAEDNLLSAQRRVEDAEVTLRKAEQDYSKGAQQTLESVAQNSVSATLLRFDIGEQETVVGALEELVSNGCVIYSDYEGIVASAMSEGSVINTAPIVSFRDTAKGFEAQMRLSKTDADKLAVGDECEVTTGGGSMYFTPTVTGTVSSISLPDENDNVTVSIRLPDSDWTEGKRVDVQAILSSGNYELCVPISALHSDNTGYYLFVVEQHSTVLGLQNVVTRVNVNVTASDSEMASVRGPVDRNTQVITDSNKSVSAGDRVRISESG
ncbi:MAG: hypothetical protein LBH28_04785 [Oscillospiraceae bacterium]|nr:hypothetical protein [Oscillospiraceae bacterium]